MRAFIVIVAVCASCLYSEDGSYSPEQLAAAEERRSKEGNLVQYPYLTSTAGLISTSTNILPEELRGRWSGRWDYSERSRSYVKERGMSGPDPTPETLGQMTVLRRADGSLWGVIRSTVKRTLPAPKRVFVEVWEYSKPDRVVRREMLMESAPASPEALLSLKRQPQIEVIQ